MASIDDGHRTIQDFGNTGNINYFIINNLEPGLNYYWSVQTLDNTFAASEFADEQVFYLPLTSVVEQNFNNNILNVYPNPGNDFLNVKMTNHVGQSLKLIVISSHGEIVIEKTINSEDLIEVSSLIDGIYFLKIDDGINTFTSTFMKK